MILRWLNELSSYPIEQVIHRTTHEVFTTDGLSRSGWMDMAADDEDPGVWPITASATINKAGEKYKSNSGDNEVSRFILYHLRHQQCPHNKEGIGLHPWSDIQCLVLKQFGEWLPKEELIKLLDDSKRAIITKEGVGAICGHSKGKPPR